MKDKEMLFWTTPPHCLLVIRAGTGLGSKLLGMVAMQKNNDKSAQLNRLSVRPDVRGIGVGKKLVMAIIQVFQELVVGPQISTRVDCLRIKTNQAY